MQETAETPRRRLTGAVIPALAAAALAGIGALVVVGLNQRPAPVAPAAPENCILSGIEGIGGPISLIDAHGATVTQADFAGSPAIVYFGFTHCPDVCPTALFTMAQALDRPGSYDLQTIFVTVDPERDNQQVVDAYTHTDGFPAGLVGLTGSRAQIEAAEQAFRVYASRAGAEAGSADYTVDHTSLAYVMDGQWRVRSVIRTPGATAEQVSQCIAAGLGGTSEAQ